MTAALSDLHHECLVGEDYRSALLHAVVLGRVVEPAQPARPLVAVDIVPLVRNLVRTRILYVGDEVIAHLPGATE